ncbi:MAG TPA: ATP synthase F1 subunit epsilon [Bacteroidales bacterium]|jgi:F-type H+-transporting ATPase subunit epsilon|nr:ATP synthase F1 subunit epsilon [Bacteroidales bacterium]MDX9907537.1 ATP synthase F1 subunit epsilon [Bacteroidales bacterium]HNQ83839.1 ATP synthase F1 subunit epsilon [Bacteroidales bacterium]HOX78084.1 ATP synthase F1 subunit epsilon [Bacteroidales bacterium]HPI85133.1 ATP synthase F1 subunit epsilon [Bacteroidales bacterium]
MKLEIITPEQTLFTGEATLVQMPGIDGSFEILSNHAPMISVLSAGRIKIQDAQKQLQYFDVKGGVVEVLNNKVLVLAE